MKPKQQTTMKGYLDVNKEGIRPDVYAKLTDMEYPTRTLE